MKDHKLGVLSGMGMGIANMIGAGVFLSASYMPLGLDPKQILAAWIIGTLLALAGAKAYSGIAQLVPQSGGEYRFLSTLIHPALGYLAGWASLLIGFSAPIAVNALAAGTFAGTLYSGTNTKLFAALMILGLTAIHAIGLRFSVAAQNTLVALKILLVAGFIAAGLIGGNNSWPEWTHQADKFPIDSFMSNMLFVTFAFSGWNAAVYAASEFKNPKRDVPRAMIFSCVIVGVIYLFINWVFIANLTPEQLDGISYVDADRITTLGHLIMKNILGGGAAACMSVLAIIAFISSSSAMTFLGPRVYSAMAHDGFLPAVLKGKDGKPPVGAVMLQGAIALFLVFAYKLQEVLSGVGAILTLFSALTVFSLFWVYFKRKEYKRPASLVLIVSGFYIIVSAVILYFSFMRSPKWNLWVGACILAALIGYFIAKRKNTASMQ